ncbi:MAG: hypothetical protein ACE5JG_12170, partial [Planctomycetota bacterium]
MTQGIGAIERLLRRLDARRCRRLARRWAGDVFLVGATLAAVLLLLERAGVGVPLVELPHLDPTDPFWVRTLGLVAVSLAGLAQGAALLCGLALVSITVRLLAPWLARRGGARTA